MSGISRLALSVLVVPLLLAGPASAFDTFWHVQETQTAGRKLGFSRNAIDVMKLGNFSPDLFGPVEDYAAQHLTPAQREALQAFKLRNAQARAAAVFLHFDNLASGLDTNAKFDYLFERLLENTRVGLAEYGARSDLDAQTRKTVVLVMLGASMHMVQDFYSHSDWIHNDFDKTAAKMVRNGSDIQRAPTWFEVRDRMGDPAGWPFQIKSGVYPPVAGLRNSHTHMNHDNSRLLYREEETPGKPLLSQAQYHEAGPAPARPGDDAAIFRHQQLAVATAAAASIEWVALVEQNPEAKAAIEFAKDWKVRDAGLGREVQAGLAMEMSLSCAAGRWDGEDPPAERGLLCKAMNEKVGSLVSGSNPLSSGMQSGWKSQLEGLAGGLGAMIAFPTALQYAGTFWDVHARYLLLERLTQGFSSNAGAYRFADQEKIDERNR